MSQYVILGGGRARRVWCGRVVDWRTRGRVETGSPAVVCLAFLLRGGGDRESKGNPWLLLGK